MEKLEVGQLAPDFRLKNSDGVEISLKEKNPLCAI
ncbi:hypothetical protein N405_00360 [Helicobacter pylori FD568]|nr:hypothetical protein N405_00360 [Helicobacter pylori FD568]